MKPYLLTLLSLLFCHFIPKPHADSVVRKVADKLNRLHEISYTSTLNIRYFSEGYERDLVRNVYMKFDEQNPLGITFQDIGQDYTHIYNGDSLIEIEKKKGTIELTNKPELKAFNSKTFLVNSFYPLRKFLPVLLAKNPDQISVSDTTIGGTKYATASFTLTNMMLHRFGYSTPLDLKKNITYTIVIDNDLPYMVVQRDNLNPKDYMQLTFTDLAIDSKRPTPESWRYETYVGQYKLMK